MRISDFNEEENLIKIGGAKRPKTDSCQSSRIVFGPQFLRVEIKHYPKNRRKFSGSKLNHA